MIHTTKHTIASLFIISLCSLQTLEAKSLCDVLQTMLHCSQQTTNCSQEKKQIDQLSTALSESKSYNRDLIEKNNSLEKEKQELKSNLDQAQQKNDDLSRENDSLKHEVSSACSQQIQTEIMNIKTLEKTLRNPSLSADDRKKLEKELNKKRKELFAIASECVVKNASSKSLEEASLKQLERESQKIKNTLDGQMYDKKTTKLFIGIAGAAGLTVGVVLGLFAKSQNK
jgi:predicted RNase H-like nuclease (RuvC/YqgF family)